MWFETSNYTWGRSDPYAPTEQWVDPWQGYQFDFAWTEELSSELGSIGDDEYFSWDDEDETSLSLLCAAYDPIPAPDAGMDWQSDGLQYTSMWEVATDCGVAAEPMVSTDIEMLDTQADPAYNYHHFAEEPEEMDWAPCDCTDADNDIVMKDMP